MDLDAFVSVFWIYKNPPDEKLAVKLQNATLRKAEKKAPAKQTTSASPVKQPGKDITQKTSPSPQKTPQPSREELKKIHIEIAQELYKEMDPNGDSPSFEAEISGLFRSLEAIFGRLTQWSFTGNYKEYEYTITVKQSP